MGTPPLDFNGMINLTVVASDGTLEAEQSFDLIIDPVNDAAVISGNDTGTLQEDVAVAMDGNLVASGVLNVTDVDDDEDTFNAEMIMGHYGSLTIDVDGNWSYAADNAQLTIQELSEGETLRLMPMDLHSEIFTVASYDGTTHDITIDIVGSDVGENILGTDINDILTGSFENDLITAGACKDILYGGDGNDLLMGEEENDIIFGGLGDDFLIGGLGDDVLIGSSSGVDLVEFSNDQAEYSGLLEDYFVFDLEAGFYIVIDKISGRDGVDILKDIELLSFEDQQEINILNIVTTVNESVKTLSDVTIVRNSINTVQNINENNSFIDVTFDNTDNSFYKFAFLEQAGTLQIAQANSSVANALALLG